MKGHSEVGFYLRNKACNSQLYYVYLEHCKLAVSC